jgi:hypothetical protein
MGRWEYKVDRWGAEDEESLNRHGEDGWELVSVAVDPDYELARTHPRPYDPDVPPTLARRTPWVAWFKRSIL